MDLSFDLIDLLGYAAAGLVFLTFCMKTLIWLRIVAVASNVAFIAYALGAGLLPILILHGVLLPLNLFRLWEHYRMIRQITRATRGDPNASVLMPFMESVSFRDGDTVFRMGDPAERLYYVQDGQVEIVEFGKTLGTGEIFGEVGLLSEGKKRTASVRCVGDTILCWIDRAEVLRICRENPEFVLMLARLITDRMVQNQGLLGERLENAARSRIS